MSDPRIFVRVCPSCRVLVQTADPTGATPCDACASKETAKPRSALVLARTDDAREPEP